MSNLATSEGIFTLPFIIIVLNIVKLENQKTDSDN